MKRDVIYGVIFHFHREPANSRFLRRATRNGPRLENPVKFQPEVPMQTCRMMLLHHEPMLLCFLDFRTRLGRLGEISLLAIIVKRQV